MTATTETTKERKFKQIETKNCISYEEAVKVYAARGADLKLKFEHLPAAFGGKDFMRYADGETHKLRIKLRRNPESFDVITYGLVSSKKAAAAQLEKIELLTSLIVKNCDSAQESLVPNESSAPRGAKRLRKKERKALALATKKSE